ncbi:MAG TPA: hypothetical protein VJX93_02940 [Candidatus Methanomethylophilaceae archaeon]|nr:hypothetical protein [Candidatus Methanomethylophilaceae archaeon]
MEMKKVTKYARAAFFIFAAMAFIGVGIYAFGHTYLGVSILAIGIFGFLISMAIIKNTFRVEMSIAIEESRKKRRK